MKYARGSTSRFKEYNVYRRYTSAIFKGDGYEAVATPWKWMGSTRAVSEQQARNHVQFRLFEDGTTQFKGRNRVQGEWTPQWKAVVKYSAEDKKIYESTK